MSDPAELIWSNLSIRTKQNKEIISDCNSQIAPGTMTAIMGPCGSGKTTLINVLAGHNSSEYIVNGCIYVNGRDRDPRSWSQMSAFVTHQLEAYEYQSVAEALEFAANAKIKYQEVRRQRIKDVIIQLKITDILKRRIKHLSTGERMLLNIGMVLLGDPSLIFCDEPTSGLDSHNSSKILATLKALANRGKTVIVVIHQPTSSMLQYFDFMVLMGRGLQICNGTVANCIKFFSNCGYELPPNTNPADHFLEVISDVEEDANLDEKLRSIKDEWTFTAEPIFPILSNPIAIEDSFVSFASFRLLTIRNLQNLWRNRSSMIALFIKKAIVCMAYSLVFYDCCNTNYSFKAKEYDSSGNVIRTFTSNEKLGNSVEFPGMMSCVIANILFGLSSTIIGHYSSERKIIDYERRSGYYGAFLAYLSKVASDVLISLIFELPTLLVMYFFVHLSRSFLPICVFILAIVLLTVLTTSYAYLVAISLPNTQTSISIAVTCNILMVAFSGILANYSWMPFIAKFISHFSPINYVYNLIYYTQNQYGPQGDNSQNGHSYWDEHPLRTIIPINAAIILLFILFFNLVGIYFFHRRTRMNLALNKTYSRF